jgi:hypothetical protein
VISSTFSVLYRYLLADSVSAKGNFTWAGQVSVPFLFRSFKQCSWQPLPQTLGAALKSDGRLNGTLNVTTVQCNQAANTCSIPVPAPAFALVFLTTDSLHAVSPTSTVTFPTSLTTNTGSNIYIDPSMLATAYGHSGMENVRGATSPGSLSGASTLHTTLSGALAIFVSVLGAAVVAWRW